MILNESLTLNVVIYLVIKDCGGGIAADFIGAYYFV